MSCVYIIPCKCKKVYVGSTLRRLSRRQTEHRSECFNKHRKSFHTSAYKHFRECGMTKKDIKCIKIADSNPDTMKLEEAKFIKYIGNLNSNLSVLDEEKKLQREECIRVEGQKTKYCQTCGGRWTYSHKNRHLKSKKHLALLGQNNIISTNSTNEFMDSACKENGEKGEVFLQGSDVTSQVDLQTENKKIKGQIGGEKNQREKHKTKKVGWDKEKSIFYFKED